jgi:hypothetical protein
MPTTEFNMAREKARWSGALTVQANLIPIVN